MASTWRIHLKPGNKDDYVLRKALINYCIVNGVVCIGWQVNHSHEFENRDLTKSEKDYIWENVVNSYSSSRGVKKAINPLIYNMQIGDYVWTRDLDGIYYLGKITSDYRISSSHSFGEQGFDIGHWRSCEWVKLGTDVPGAVIRSFAPSATVQRIVGGDSKTIFDYSHHRWLKDDFTIQPKQLFDFLLPSDFEDLVALFLQVEKGYVLTPSSIAPEGTTIKYEYELVSKETGKHALVQVKSGNVSLSLSDFDRLLNEIDADVWLFFANESYTGNKNERLHTIHRSELLGFIRENTRLLSGSLGFWTKKIVW